MKTFDGKVIEIGKTYYATNCYKGGIITIEEGVATKIIDRNCIHVDGFKYGNQLACLLGSTKEAAYAELSERLNRIDIIKAKERDGEVKKKKNKIKKLKEEIHQQESSFAEWINHSEDIQHKLEKLK